MTRDNLGQSERGVHDAGVADENVKGGMGVGSSKGRHRRKVLHKSKTRLLTTVNQTDFLMGNRCNLKQMIGVVTFRSIMPKVTSPEWGDDAAAKRRVTIAANSGIQTSK